MRRESWTEFGGVAGRVLSHSLGITSLISGIGIAFILFVGGFVAGVAQAPGFALWFGQIIFSLALARFAVNGLFGEWDGTVFSTKGGSWGHVTLVAFRYFFLNALYMIPMVLLGLKPEAAMGMGMGGSGKMIGLFLIYMVVSTLTPPLFLIVAVTAGSFGDIFSPTLWRANFAGRRDDLFSLYSVYAGALAMAIVLSILPVAGAFMISPKLGVFVAGVGIAFLFGLMITLLGRLAGFYAFGDRGLEGDAAGDSPLRPMPETPLDLPADGAPAVSGNTAPVAPAPLSATPVSPAAATAAAAPPVAAAPAAAPVEGAPAVAPSGTRLPPLLDAGDRVDAALKRFANDRAGALSALEDLSASFAPHPHVLQALALCLFKSQQAEAAIEAANRALPLCFERGHMALAADIYREMRVHQDRLAIGREQMIAIGASLVKKEELVAAAKAYSWVIEKDAGDARAIKGLLAVAERVLDEHHKPEIAVKMYRYLKQRCGHSPLIEFIDLGLANAERKLPVAAPATR